MARPTGLDVLVIIVLAIIALIVIALLWRLIVAIILIAIGYYVFRWYQKRRTVIH